jgi:phosphatidylserine decarboxylase
MNPDSQLDKHPASIIDYLKTLPIYLLPHHLLSRLMMALTRVRFKPIKNAHIKWFIKQFGVDMAIAENPDPCSYPDFNSFFTRAIKSDARAIVAGTGQIACPVDGKVSQGGQIKEEMIFQAKGHQYTLTTLLGGNSDRTKPFRNGAFVTLYLSPKDYHRIHMPLDGVLKEMIHIPGRLFSVSPASTRVVSGLFARNERVVTLFDTEVGPMALIMVGALNVGSIETVWHGVVTPPSSKIIKARKYPKAGEPEIRLRRGDELGRFNMGSTVILLFGQDAVTLSHDISAGNSVRMGQLFATQ